MRKITFVIILIILVQLCFAQQNDLKRYLNNIVEVGAGEFGLIVGDDNNHTVYFITASTKDDEGAVVFAPQLFSKFYRQSAVNKAIYIRKFSVGSSEFALYSVNSIVIPKWEKYSYGTLGNGSGMYRTFMDNGKPDSMWFVNSANLNVNEKIGGNLFQFRVSRDDVFFKGMPVVDASKGIVGIIAQSQTDKNEVAFTVIDIKAVEEQLFEFSNCRYFNMIAIGETGTRCQIENEIRVTKFKEVKQAKQDLQVFAFAHGPGYAVNYTISGGYNGGLGGFGIGAGWNLFINPDRGKFRVTLKPRYSRIRLNANEEYTFNSTIGYRPKSFRIRNFELPITLEWVTKRGRNGNSYVGFGYTAAYQQPVVFSYTQGNSTSTNKKTAIVTAGSKHKINFDLGYESGRNRVSFFANYQLTPWSDYNYYLTVDNYAIHAFEGAGLSYLMIGIEFLVRLKGSWDIKVR